ncbi:MAG: CocE/NonD family hydrolase, partial [Gammaproteobacteria bacterium]|nr:CocE/NonD family hydrolase [Gammaproteobacteria bacterium]
MKIVDRFPHRVEVHDDVRITMRDGTELAARLWLPESAKHEPAPAILEYIPYRRRDGTAARDAANHGWFAGHGYACLRVDMRGSGDSGGILEDEYTQQELDDGVEVLRWLGEQPWCTGRVGMMGISWGGFNALQIAAMDPPELCAVISASSTDDRYADDVHHMGGCLLGDNLSWASIMFAFNSLPPDPQSVGDSWREIWLERLEHCSPWLVTWLEHQRRDRFWRHGSFCEDFSAITCPVFAVSGWADGYSNAVFRLLEKLDVPRRGLVGPWGHLYPHMGQPG